MTAQTMSFRYELACIGNKCKQTTFKKDSYRRQSGTSKTAKIGCFDRFPCTVSPLQCSGIRLKRNGETVRGNLPKHPIFAVLDVPRCRI